MTVIISGCGGAGGSAASAGGTGGSGGTGSSGSTAYMVNVDVTGLSGNEVVLQDNGGDDLTVKTSGTFEFATSFAGGAAYDVTILTQPTSPAQACSVTSPSGKIADAAVTLTVTCTTRGRYLYVSNQSDSTISGYAINSTTGALSALIGSPFAVANADNLGQLEVDPSGRFLYVVDESGANVVYGFSIDQATGALTAVSGSPVPTLGGVPGSLAFDPSGKHLYIGDTVDAAVAVYSIDPTTGALTSVGSGGGSTGMPVVAGSFNVPGFTPFIAQMITTDNFLYAANSDGNAQDDEVAAFNIATSTGVPSVAVPGSPYKAGVSPYGLAVDPTGAVLFIAANGVNFASTISAFLINSSTGALTAVAGNPVSIPVFGPIAVDAQGKFLIALEGSGVLVYPFNVTTGVLGAGVAGSPFSVLGQPISLACDPAGNFVYVGNLNSNTVTEFALDGNTGALTPVAGSPTIGSGRLPISLAID